MTRSERNPMKRLEVQIAQMKVYGRVFSQPWSAYPLSCDFRDGDDVLRFLRKKMGQQGMRKLGFQVAARGTERDMSFKETAA